MQHYRQQLLQKFEEEYQKLNPQQRKAVDSIEGPVMVIAGPGTGKTQILAARIGKILLETDALPQNILCLTYTDAGAIAMRRRLQQFIGADAYKVNLYTFHAFCNDVIQDNLALFEKTALDAISELETIELYKMLIDAFPKNHPLKRYRGDVYFEINNLRQLFATMKKEGWTPSFIKDCIAKYLLSLPYRDEYVYKRKFKQYNPGDIKAEKIEEEKEKMLKLEAAVAEFDNYQALLRKKNRYDFDDMIMWVIKAFEENAHLLANYQEKFQYLLVDEFQDTSNTQNRIVQLLISYWSEPNIFTVGDDDQSIYRFQGANIQNMESFLATWQKLEVIVLENNYRSIQPILDIAQTLIRRNNDRLINSQPNLGLSKNLIAANTKINNLTHPPIFACYNNVADEMADVTRQIEVLVNQQQMLPGKIAVIYKENKYGQELARYLRLCGIPVFSKKQTNILHEPFIKKIITLLQYLDAEHDISFGGDELLFEILHFDFYKIPPIEIAKLNALAQQKRANNEKNALRRVLAEQAAKLPATLFDTGMHPQLKNCGALLEQLIADVPNITLQNLIDNIIQHAGVLSYLMQQPNKLELLQLLTTFFDFVKSETARNPTLSLNGLMQVLDLMQKEELAIELVQVSGNEKGVNLLTAHGSKGLEFEQVFFVGINAGSWEKKRKPGGGYKLPDTMFTAMPTGGDEEELRRLFYVAVTRAEKNLQISYANFKNDGKQLEPSMFVAEILSEHNLPIVPITLSETDSTRFKLLQFTPAPPVLQKLDDDFVQPLVEKFVMNVTALSNYLKCPLAFYYQNLIRIPSGKNEATEFGSAIHHALEQLFRQMLGTAQQNKTIAGEFPAVESLLKDFEWYMTKHRELFTKTAFLRRMEYGHEVLRNYYKKYVDSWHKIVTVERNIRSVLVNGVPIKGKLDKLEFDGKNINVVDYKSGDFEKALIKLKGPSDTQPHGGDYWRQAVFYKLLIDHYEQKDWTVVSTEFDFVEPDKKQQYHKAKIVITPADTATVKQQIAEVWQKIQQHDFYTGCGKADCHWCNFVKTNQLDIAKTLQAEEEEVE
jgi:DNA helicase II / ATP-dependent DNA helicase PcrA